MQEVTKESKQTPSPALEEIKKAGRSLKATLGEAVKKGEQLLDGTSGMTPEEAEAYRKQKVATKMLKERQKQEKILADTAEEKSKQAAEERNATDETIGTVIDFLGGVHQGAWHIGGTKRQIDHMKNRHPPRHNPRRPGR